LVDLSRGSTEYNIRRITPSIPRPFVWKRRRLNPTNVKFKIYSKIT
jgi:hypothetical protein